MHSECTTLHRMDEPTQALAAAIGTRVRQHRAARHWTLDQLADAAGVSRRSLVNVEQGAANPSVGTLLRLSDALGVGLPALVEQPRTRALQVTRRGEGATLWRSAAGGRAVLLAGTPPPDVVELWEWTLGPGDRYDSEAHTAGTRELLQVLQGAVTVDVADDSVALAKGDALSFSGDAPHAYVNPGRAPARFSLAVFEPGVAARQEAGGA